MKNRTSSSYRFSFNVNDQAGYEMLERLRKEISEKNKEGGFKQRVCVMGRLGKDNPAAVIYQERARICYPYSAYQTIQLEHAARFDVYVYMR